MIAQDELDVHEDRFNTLPQAAYDRQFLMVMRKMKMQMREVP